MNKKKIIYSIVLALVLILGYLNYYSSEKEIETSKEQVIETLGAIYDGNGYHIEAEKQKDFLSKDKTTFDKAKAIVKDLTLTGDTGLLDSGKNLLLKYNIFGKSLNGWEFKTEEIKYNQTEEKISSTIGITAINKEQKLEIQGKNFESDTKFTYVNLVGDVRIKTKGIILSAEKATYNGEDKTIRILGRAYLSGSDDDNKIEGEFEKIIYNTETGNLTTDNKFYINYNDVILNGDKLFLNEKTEEIKITGNVYAIVDGYRINMKKIISNGEDIVEFVGKITGSNGEYDFTGNRATYNKRTKELVLSGNVTGKNKDNGKIIADKVIYSTENKVLNLTSKTFVKYTDLKNKLTTRKLKYSTTDNMVYAAEGYDYEGEEYSSTGQELLYNTETESGIVSDGKIKNILQNQLISGKKLSFDRKNDNYKIEGKGYFEDLDYILESEEINYLGKDETIYFPVKYSLKRKNREELFTGNSAEYNLKNDVFKSFGEVEYENSKNKINGYNLNFDKKTGLGNIEKDIKIYDKENNTEIKTKTLNFKEDEYVRLNDKILLKNEKFTMNAKSAEYKIKEQKIYIREEIDFKNKENNFVGKMYNGIYSFDKKEFIAENFKGNTLENNFRSDKIKFYTDKSDVILEKNAIIEGQGIVLNGDRLEYELENDIVKSTKEFNIKNSEYNITAKNGEVNKKSKKFKGRDVIVNFKKNGKIKGDYVIGSFGSMKFDFKGNVLGEAVQNGVPTYFEGDLVKTSFEKDETGKNQLQKIEIIDNGILKRENNTIYSDNLKVDSNERIIIGSKNNKAVLKKSDTVITVTSDAIKGYLDREVIELRKNVVLDNGETIITADEIDYFLKTEEVNARGDVFVDYKHK